MAEGFPRGIARSSIGVADASINPRWNVAVEEPGTAILDTDLRGVITAWDTGAQRLFGYTSTEAVGQSLGFLIPTGRHSEQDELTVRAEHRRDHRSH